MNAVPGYVRWDQSEVRKGPPGVTIAGSNLMRSSRTKSKLPAETGRCNQLDVEGSPAAGEASRDAQPSLFKIQVCCPKSGSTWTRPAEIC